MHGREFGAVVTHKAYIQTINRLPQEVEKVLKYDGNFLLSPFSLFDQLSLAYYMTLFYKTAVKQMEIIVRLPEEKKWNKETLMMLPLEIYHENDGKRKQSLYGTENWFEMHNVENGIEVEVMPLPADTKNFFI